MCGIQSPCSILILSCCRDFYINKLLLLDDRSCYDFGSAISPSIAPGSCYYQAGVWVGLEGITRVMPLYESLAWGAWVGLKGLATIINLPTPSALVFILLYVANILAIAQDIED